MQCLLVVFVVGTISISVATMSKKNRCHTNEVYVVGFVPTYLLPKGRVIPLDPFLAPLCNEIVDGFIQGKAVVLWRTLAI